MNLSPFQRGLAGAVALSVLVFTGAGAAIAQPSAEIVFEIPASPLGDALRAFGAQSGTGVAFAESVVAGQSSPGVSGDMSPAAALAVLLEGSGLEAVPGAGGYIIRAQSRAPVAEPLRPAPAAPPARLPPAAQEDSAPAAEPGDEADLRISRVTVTGTSLRGFAPESSPLQVYSREDILGSGVTTTEQFIRTLPQNFGGGSSEYAPAGLPGDFNSARNNTLGTGANLRGLGSGGTLVLLNGNRLAPSSTVGDFVDLSMIPVSALERVDVLSDGASSIYGGDAVAGVINFVLRGDYDGAETALRYGAVTQGEMQELRFSQTLGRSWDSGNILATYEHHERDRLSLGDRPGIASPSGSVPIPESARGMFDLLPSQNRDSAVLALRQEAGSALELSASALWSERSSRSNTILAGVRNRMQEADAVSETWSVNLGADYEISDRWTAALGGTWSEVNNTQQFEQYNLGGPPDVGYGVASASRLWSADALINGDLLELPGGTLRVAVGGQYRDETFSSGLAGAAPQRDASRDVSSAFMEVLVPLVGEGNALPGIRRLEANLSGRIDRYSDFGTSRNPKIGLLWSPAEGLNLRGSYSTSFAPPALGYVGATDRGALIAPYAFLAASNGVAPADPSLNVDMMFISGTAAGLGPETSTTYTAGIDYDLTRGAHSWKAAATWYDISFEGRLGQTPIPGNVNWYIAPNIAWNDPGAFPEGTVVFFPTTAEIDAAFDRLQLAPIFFLTATREGIGIINTVNLVRNLAATNTSGLDLTVGYAFDSQFGVFSADLNLNHILDFTRQAAPSSPEVSVLDTFLNPVATNLRGQLSYQRGGSAARLIISHKGRYKTDGTAAARAIPSWTTADLVLSQKLDGIGPGWMDEVEIGLSVTNLFDTAPPKTPTLGTSLISGYDPANASPLGRFVAAELRIAF